MIDELAKDHLHDALQWVRDSLVAKLDGLSEYDIRRPLTATGTNLLGLVKHLSVSESRYFSEIFGRPLPEPLRPWDDPGSWSSDDMWAAEHETRADIVDRYRRAWALADATIVELPIDAPGHVPWWPRPDVTLFDVLVHILAETNRHAGHADILREHLDGSVGGGPGDRVLHGRDAAYWQDHCARIEQAARAADPNGGR